MTLVWHYFRTVPHLFRLASPSQLLMGRILRSPTTRDLRVPRVPDPDTV